MKQSPGRSRNTRERAIALRVAENDASHANAAGTLDDYANDAIYDAEDERAEIDSILRATAHDAD